ncbi:MAG: hypothetical protein HY775_04165 [Acidobacteria bacterium]|nr:hypothetical protein [Acidobacteriota bacterium]
MAEPTRSIRPDRISRSAALLGAATAFLAAAGLIAPPAVARDVEGITLTAKKPRVQKQYPPIPGQRSNPSMLDWNLDECRTAEYCDLITITFDPGRPNGHLTKLRIEWRESQSIEARLYEDRALEVGEDDQDRMVTDLRQGTSNDPAVSVLEGTVVDLQKGKWPLAVMCFTSTCDFPHTLKATIEFEELFTPSPETEPSFTPFTPPPEESPSPPPQPSAGGPLPPDPALTPGADGRARTRSLDPVPLGQQAEPPSNRVTDITNITLAFLLVAVLLGGSVMVAIRIRRDLRR